MRRQARSFLTALALALPLAACADSNSDVVAVVQVFSHSSGLFGGDDAVSRERAAAIPYASIGLRLGSGAEGLLVLATSSGQNLRWQAGTKLTVTTRDGRVVHTTGFAHNLDGYQGPLNDSGSGAGARETSYNFLYDMADMNRYNVLAHCKRHDAGPERIVIIGVEHDTRHIVEDCEAPQLDWKFSNDFWVDAATGYVWKSRQNFRPDVDELTLEVFRPEK
jgi:hypothetical protein